MSTLLKLIFVATIVSIVSPVWSQGDKWTTHPDTAVFNYYTQKELSVDLLRKEAGGKRILVFYYEHFSIHANHFNGRVLNDTSITNFILRHFYPIAIDLDIDKMDPNDEDKGRSKTYRKFLVEQTYYVKVTPAFSIYNSSGVLRGSKPYLNASEATRKEFMEFMQKRLK